ncbi:uncharacterized protein LOC111861670 isoform X3 [Cryptotermes secundus]|uniref:uncharacterized protein LOC111861670 isoform X3 n=1 Tax=Cryptotermes secundus TaxID=105785 RepID=UPI000CD7D67E|nr:uncharacterized protein LOC111861670 isoform X3 [Cryptotermes secundus]
MRYMVRNMRSLELLKNPVCTRCSHSFCRECVMTIINTKRNAHCPLCNKSINRRSIIENEKIGKLVGKVQSLIDSIGRDTGFDITSHRKLPSSTCEAVIASPKFHQKPQEILRTQYEASSQKVTNPTVTTSKEHWLRRYKHSYPGKRDSRDDNVDFLSVSQAEPPSFIARDIALLAEESKVDKLNVPPMEKVQQWLQKNGDEFHKDTVEPSESNNVTITADVHRGMEDEIDLVSVSQRQFYVAPRKADVAAFQSPLASSHDNVKQASSEKRIFTSRIDNGNNRKLCERVREGQSAEGDPYTFVSSQKIRTVPKKKVKGKVAVKERESKHFQTCGPSFEKGNNTSTGGKNKATCNSPPVFDITFICPVDINDTFDNLVADTCKSEPAKTVEAIARKVATGDDSSDDDVCLFRTPLDVPLMYKNNDGSTTESMSDIDFSSGSDEEWGVTNQVNQELTQVSRRKTRGNSCGNLPTKVRETKSSCGQKSRSKSSGICPRRNGKLEAFGFGFKEVSKHNLQNEDHVKNPPLSPAKKLNLTTNIVDLGTDNMKQGPSIYKDTNNKSKDEYVTCLSSDKAPTGKENVICPVANDFVDEKINLDHPAVNTTICSWSPGWSRISQSKKDFERFKKPELKALNVSGGEVCIPKRHSASVSEIPKKPDITSEVISPVPTIEDSDSFVGIPVIAFNSPEAMNRVKMMSKIVANLESQIGCDSSTENVAEVSTETIIPQTVKDVTVKKFRSFGSDAFSESVGTQDSPKSCQRKKLIGMIVSSLEADDQLEHQCIGGDEQIMSGITKLDGDDKDAQDSYNKDNDKMKNSVVCSKENILTVQESESTLAYEEDTENDEHNQGSHSKDNYCSLKNLVVDMNKENVLTVHNHNSNMACEETVKNIEHNQDSHIRDHDNMKNPVTDMSMGNVLMVQESESSAANEETLENMEQTHMMGQIIKVSREDCIKISRSTEPLTEPADMSSKDLNNQTEVSFETGQNGSLDSKQLIIHQGKGECKAVNPLLAASKQHLQDFVLSKKCDQKKVSVMSSDVGVNFTEVPKNSHCETYSTKGTFTGVQPQVMNTEPMEIKTKNCHQTDIQSQHNSSIDLVNNHPNEIHIPFIKYGRLKSLRNFTKFVLLGSLAPRRKNAFSETFQACSSVDSIGVQSGATGRSSSGICYETGTQTSPQFLNPCHSSDVTDAKIQITPRENPKFVQLTTPTRTDTQEDGENFVPDSCDSTYSFPCAIPLCHPSTIQKTPVDSSKYAKPEHCLKTCGISEPLSVDRMLAVSDVKDHVAEDDVGMDRTLVFRNHGRYSEPAYKVDHEISSSQFSTATTIKIQHVRTSGNGSQVPEKSPELSSNLAKHSGLSISIVQESNNGKILDSIEDLYDTDTNQEAVSDVQDHQDSNPNNEERNTDSHQKTEVIESKRDGSTEHLIQDLNSKPSRYKPIDCSNTYEEKSRKKSRKVSRQLKFSPNDIPKLSNPCLDVNIEDREGDVEKLHKKSNKRIREAAISLDLAPDDRELSDMLDLEPREMKKPCHTSLSKALGEGKDNDVLPDNEYADTSTDVINLLTPPEEANVSLTPQVDDKWLGEDVPNSEELMARLMANIEADLVETRKRKMKGGNDSDKERGKESPTIFTPPPVIADSEPGSRMTCELVVSKSGAEPRRRRVKESFLGNTTIDTDSESLCTQQRNKIQADIHNLEAEIKECKAELQKVTETRPVHNTHLETVCDNSESESEDDFVEPTQKKEITANRTWDNKHKDDTKAENKEVHLQQVDQVNLATPFSAVQNTGKRSVLHNPDSNCILPTRSPSVINSMEIQRKETSPPKYQTAVKTDVKSHMTCPTSKQFVLRLPQVNTPSTSPMMRRDKDTTPGILNKSSVAAKSSNIAADVYKHILPQSSLQVSTLKPPPRKLSFVCSGLHTGLIARVKALSKLLGAEFSNKFESHTTHLVVKASDTMMADKTLKYLLALVKKKWIVSVAWVNACLQARKLVPEDEYEMLDSSGENGPHRSRTTSELLYRNFEFCCIEPFTDLSRDQLEEILKECGAVTVSHPGEFSFKAGHYCMIIVHMEAKREECKEWWERYGVLPVGHEWVFECIGRYRIIPIWSFLTCAVTEDQVRTLGYPEEALISDDDDDDDETAVESQM